MPIISTGLTPIEVAKRSPYRTSITFENRDPAAIIYLDVGEGLGLTTTNASLKVGIGDTLTLDWLSDGDRVNDRWVAVADTATTDLAVFEGFTTEGSALWNFMRLLKSGAITIHNK